MQHPAGALGIEPPAHPLLKSVPQAADTHPAPQVPLRSRSPHLHLTCSPAPGADPGPQSPGVSGDTGSREAIAPGASHLPVGQGLQTQAALQSEFLLPGQSVLGGFKTKSSFIQQTPDPGWGLQCKQVGVIQALKELPAQGGVPARNLSL